MSQFIKVAVGILVQGRTENVRVLIARRPENVVLGGYWEFPGGKVEPGESLQACLVREFKEELGILVRPGQQLERIVHHYEYGVVELNPFYCELLAGEPQNLAVAEHKWIDPAELGCYRFPEANRDLLEQVMAALAGEKLPHPHTAKRLAGKLAR